MDERLRAIWRRTGPAPLVAGPLLALGIVAYVLIGARGSHTALPPRPVPTARITPTARVIAAVPHLTPTTLPPTATRPAPSPVATRTSTPPPHVEHLHSFQFDGRRSHERSAAARPSKAPARRPGHGTHGATVTVVPATVAAGTPQPRPTSPPAPHPHPTIARPATTVAGVPVRLRIPALGLDTRVESVGLNGDAMDVPANPWDVAWFKLGPQPGLPGNAVIDGHLDTATGPAIFLHLGDLRPGDLLYVTDAQGNQHAFKVTQLADYPVDNAPLTRIFGASNGAHLNLITCSGDWLPQQHNYNERLVVYSSLVA